MFKVVKRPKEYIAIKVPEDCEDVGRYVSNKFRENGILVRVNVRYGNHVITTFGEGEDQHFVKQGDMLVADYSEPCGYSVRVMSQDDFDAEFKPADATPEVSPTLTAYGLCDGKMPEIKGVEMPDRPGFSESFIAELDKELNDYHQKQARYRGVI